MNESNAERPQVKVSHFFKLYIYKNYIYPEVLPPPYHHETFLGVNVLQSTADVSNLSHLVQIFHRSHTSYYK